MSASLSIEAIGIGAYEARVRGWTDVQDDTTRFEFEINLRTLLGLQVHVDNAIKQLMMRQISDAVCGDCRRCKNLRLIESPRRIGQRSMGIIREHCPVCHPKLEAAEQKGLLL